MILFVVVICLFGVDLWLFVSVGVLGVYVLWEVLGEGEGGVGGVGRCVECYLWLV